MSLKYVLCNSEYLSCSLCGLVKNLWKGAHIVFLSDSILYHNMRHKEKETFLSKRGNLELG